MRKTNKRRRNEGKTDYKSRLLMLKGDTPRVVVRKTNKYVIGQIVESEAAQDKTLLQATSKELLDYGWPKEWNGSLKSIPAAYLTGKLLGEKAKKEKIEKYILDIGLYRNIPKSRIYALLKGAVDSGMNIPHKKEILPPEEKIKGMHMKKDIEKIFNEIEGRISKK